MSKRKTIIRTILLGFMISLMLYRHSIVLASNLAIPYEDVVYPPTPTPTEQDPSIEITPEPSEITPEISEAPETVTPTQEVTPIEEVTPTEEITPTESPYAVEKDGMKVSKEKENRYYKLSIEKNGVLYCPDTSVYDYNKNKISDYYSTRMRLPIGNYYVDKYEKLNFTVDGSNCEQEYNDTYDTANYVQTNVQYTGNINRGSDEDYDYYKFELNEQNRVYVEFKTKNDSRYSVKLYQEESNGNTTKLSDQYTENSISTTSRLRLPKGTYFFVVSRQGYSTADDDYTFTIISENNGSGNYEQEWNDTIQTATSMEYGSEYIGNICNSDDEDYFKLIIPYTGKATVKMTIPRQCDNNLFKVEYFSEDDVDKYYKNYFYTNENPVNVSKEFDIAPGIYYIKVSTGSYRYNSAIDYKIVMEGKEVKEVKSLSLSGNKKSFTVGDKEQLTVTYNPSDATDKEVSWESSDSSIVSVTNAGEITCKSAGSAKITVTCKKNKEIKATLSVKVVDKVSKVTKTEKKEKPGYTYSKEEVDIGDVVNLDFYYDDSSKLKFSSSKTSIATVSKTGVVKFKKSGNVTISVTLSDGTVNKHPFYVKPKPSGDNTLKKVKASKGSVKMTGKTTFTITLSSKQTYTVIQPVTNHKKATYIIDNWYTSTKTIYVEPKKTVTVKVKVYAENGKTKTYTVKVKRK